MKTIKTVTHLNLGDNIYYIHLFRKIVDMYEGNIRIIHRLHSRYIDEVSNFIKGYEENIILECLMAYVEREVIPLEKSQIPGWWVPYPELINYHRENKNLAILLYGDADHWKENHPNEPSILDSCFFDETMKRQYIQYCEFMNVECPIKNTTDTLLDMKELLIPNSLTQEYDLLIGNSTPMSHQWSNPTRVFDYILDKIDLSKVKVISLAPTGNKDIPSTIEGGLNLLEVGNIAINSKRIIGVHSSPYCTMINKFNYESVDEFVVFQNWEQGFRYSNCNSINYRTDEDFINNYVFPKEWVIKQKRY